MALLVSGPVPAGEPKNDAALSVMRTVAQ